MRCEGMEHSWEVQWLSTPQLGIWGYRHLMGKPTVSLEGKIRCTGRRIWMQKMITFKGGNDSLLRFPLHN